MGLFRHQEPVWRNTSSPGPARNARYDDIKKYQQAIETDRRQRIEDAHDHAAKKGLQEMTDRQLHHIGLTRQRGFFGQVTGIVPTAVAHDRHIAQNEAREARKQDRKDAAKSKAKKVAQKAWSGSKGSSKRGFFYWE